MASPLDQWLNRLEKRHPTAIELGLERVAEVAARLELLPWKVPTITVAGTNGKGTTVALIAELLRRRGHAVGTYTSPHIFRFNERIDLNGLPAADEGIIRAFERIDAARGDVSLTYFEYATLAALILFIEHGVDYCVLEVGLGGRLDAVNIVSAEVAVITSIALDHQHWLGATRDLIAMEKAGIVRPGRPVVVGEPRVPASLRRFLAAHDGPVFCIDRDFEVARKGPALRLGLRSRDTTQWLSVDGDTTLVETNIATAVQAVLALGLTVEESRLQEALAGVRLRGRRETLLIDGCEYLFDVAHNPASVAALLDFLARRSIRGRTIALFSVMEDKAYRDMIRACVAAACFDEWLLSSQSELPRAVSAAELGRVLSESEVAQFSRYNSVEQAVSAARGRLRGGDRLVVFGSFTTVGAAMSALEILAKIE